LDKSINKYSGTNLFIIIILLLPALLTITSCNRNKRIDEDKFIKVYVDLIFAQDTLKTDILQIKKDVLARNSVTETEYEKTLKYYNSDPEKWREFFDKAISYLEELKKQNSP